MKKISKDKIKTWFVTGASSGVGHEMCKQLIARGYNVIAISRRIPDFSVDNVLCLSVDITNPKEIENSVKQGINKFGKIDVLVNNAGVSDNIIFEEETIDNMKRVMETNFFGTYNIMHALLPHFRINKNGTIINNSSVNGITPLAYGSAYCSSKHALEGLTSVVWHETKSFCRVMTFELGHFYGTDLGKDTYHGTKIKEYENLAPFYINYYESFINDLSVAVSYIIDEAEKEKMQRRLFLGKDAYIRIKAEIGYLKKDLAKSKKRALKCAKFDKDFIRRVINKIFKVLFKTKKEIIKK